MKKTFSAQISSLHPILDWIRTHLKQAGFSQLEIRRLEIAIEEALVNIISYAYSNKQGTIEVSIQHEEKKSIEITLKDRGRPFNPLEYKKHIDKSASIDTLKAGGLGILFMQNLVDHVEYRREGTVNSISLKKNLETRNE